MCSATENLSCIGFFCYTLSPFQVGERVDCVLDIGAGRAGARSGTLSLRCEARVVRVETSTSDERYGIACQIDRYLVMAKAGEEVR